jgi:catechol 2,3-dioxygenase-like lactoylglutathione lyase family enzyme
MPDTLSKAPQVNGVLETSLYVKSPADSAEFYRRVFGFDVMVPKAGESLDDNTRLCAMRAGDRSVLLLFKRGGTADTDAQGAIHIAFGISRSDLAVWEDWLGQLGLQSSRGNAGSTAARPSTSAIPMVICWKWLRQVFGRFTDGLPRMWTIVPLVKRTLFRKPPKAIR